MTVQFFASNARMTIYSVYNMQFRKVMLAPCSVKNV